MVPARVSFSLEIETVVDKNNVERRKEPRVEINEPVTVTVLGEPDSPCFVANAIEMSGSGMRFLSPRPVKYQATVKVQTRDLLLLGEVIRIEASPLGHLVALKLSHSLGSLSDLHHLNRELRLAETPVQERKKRITYKPLSLSIK